MLITLSPRKLAAMERFMEDMARVLGEKKIDVALLAAAGEFAYTAGKRIVINPWKISWESPVRGWLATKGMFYHEMMHKVADPVTDYAITSRGSKEISQCINMLSDQTGECRFVSKYPGAKSYFAMNVFDIILKNNKDVRTYALVYGRRSFLPKRFIKIARKLMRTKYSEKQVREVEDVIDSYYRAASTLVSERSYYELAERLLKVLGSVDPRMGMAPIAMLPERVEGGRMREDMRKEGGGKPPEAASDDDERDEEPKPKPSKSAPKADEESGDKEGGSKASDDGAEESDDADGDGAEGSDDAKADGVGAEDEGSDASEDGDEGAGEEGGKDGDGSGGDDSEGEDSGDDGNSDDGDGGSTAADGEGGRPGSDDLTGDALARSLARELKEMASDEGEDAIESEMASAERESEEMGLSGVDVAKLTEMASHELAALLRRVQAKAQAGYETGHRSGRINLRRVLQSQGRSTDIFQQYQPDRRSVTKLSIAMIGDKSGSMSGTRLEMVNQVMSAIAMACEESNPYQNKTMIRYFDDDDLLTKKPTDKFDPKRSLTTRAGDSNHPGASMFAALDWLRTETGVKVVIVLTDSHWDTLDCRCWPRGGDHNTKDQRDSLAAKDRADKEGVAIQVLHLGSVVEGDDRWKRYGLPVKGVTFEDMAEVVFDVVNEAMRIQVKKVMA